MTDKFNFDVFLSHNGQDKPSVEQIARLLRDEYGLKVWLDKWNLIPGDPWQEGLEDALDDCQTFAVFLGPSGIGPWENEEMRSALEDRVQDPKRRVIPVLLPGAPDNKDLKLPRFLRRATWVDFRSGLEDKEALYRLYCGITGQAPGDRVSSVSPKTSTTADWHLAHPYPMPPNFTGRATELKMLDDWLADEKDRLFILRALGGFGKSALAWQWINTHVDPAEWTKLVWWSFYEGDASFEHFIEETLKYLKLEVPQGQRPQVDELLKAMQSQKILLIMDGFERALRAYSSMNAAYQGDEEVKKEDNERDCVNINAGLFLKSICSLPSMKGKVLMTTRLTPRAIQPRGQFLQGCREEELKAMHKDDAVIFFHVQGIRGTHAEIESACESYGYHPLSLRILAGLIADDREKPGDIAVANQLDITDDIIANKNHVLKVAYDTLKPEQRNLLSTIACFRAPMTYDALKSISSKPSGKGKKAKVISTEELDNDLKILEKRGLLHWDRKTNKYDLHPIVRRYAYERLTAPDRTAAHTRLRDHFAAIDVPAKPQTLDDLAPVIELYHHMVGAGQFDEACDLIYDRFAKTIYYQFGAYQTYAELLTALFPDGENKLPRLKKDNDQAWTLNSLGNTYSMGGQPRRAVLLFEQAIVIGGNQGDKKNRAIRLANLAHMAQIHIGALRVAESNLRRAVTLCQEIQYFFEENSDHMNLGWLLSYRGLWREAEKELEIALKHFKKEEHFQAQSVTYFYRTQCAMLMFRDSSEAKIKNVKSAIEFAQRALGLAEKQAKQLPVERDFVRAHWLLGAAYRIDKQLNLAERHLSEALTRCRVNNTVEEEANILLDFARLRYDQKNYIEAKSLAEEALTITERCGYVLQGADVNLFLAQFALEQEKDKAKAKQYAEEAKKLAHCDDGPPYYYKVAYEEAERLLEKLNKM